MLRLSKGAHVTLVGTHVVHNCVNDGAAGFRWMHSYDCVANGANNPLPLVHAQHRSRNSVSGLRKEDTYWWPYEGTAG